ncbi:uncharacterized protein LOC124287857 isoform X1 [Haliotis rubra]|uniref:uncharacterized protein LOC124287857 isoform X1 n=1 Tax=Haliotis rubra TaxID=36100 RepID=UPI001EE5EECB|nr:uncharacterized protein LOC124287857 isoform X1 [Haliotis rubra]
MKYWTHLLFIVTTCCYVSTQNVTTEGTDTVPTVSISRELRPGSFGLPVPGIVGILTATTTSSPSTTTTGRQCPPGERWNRPRTRSFLECLCERGGPDHQPCILRLSNVLGAFSGRVIPAILPRLTGTDVGFLYLWTFEGFQCNPFMGMGGLSIACYHDIGNSPFSRDCRFSRSRYFCELLMCVDTILADTRSAPQDFLNCVRRIAVPAQNSPVYTWPHTRITHPPIIITHRTTTTDEPAVTSSLRHDDADHADHLEFDQDEHGALGDEHYKYDIIRIVGGVFGGVMTGIFITAVIFILCWFSKRRRRQESPGKQQTDTHAYLGPGHTSDSSDKNKGTNEKTSSVPDLVKTSVEPAAGEYAIISEPADVGDYTEITEDISGAAAGVSMTTASHGMTTLDGRKPEDAADNLAGQYNKLGESINLTITDVQATYNRLRDNNLASAHLRQTGNGSSAEYFVLEESDGNYNRLGQAAPITTTDATSGYHRLGDTAEAGSPQAKDTEAPPPDYFVLEEPADTYNKLGVTVAATEMATKNTYHRLENTDVDTGNRDPEPFETVLEKSGDSYNKLGEKTSAEEAHGTYNKLGEVTSEIRT